MSKPEPQHSWNSFALIDSLSALEGLVSVLPVKNVIKELLQVLYWQKHSLANKHLKGW
jgi:WD repeat-containing protein 81